MSRIVRIWLNMLNRYSRFWFVWFDILPVCYFFIGCVCIGIGKIVCRVLDCHYVWYNNNYKHNLAVGCPAGVWRGRRAAKWLTHHLVMAGLSTLSRHRSTNWSHPAPRQPFLGTLMGGQCEHASQHSFSCKCAWTTCKTFHIYPLDICKIYFFSENIHLYNTM